MREHGVNIVINGEQHQVPDEATLDGAVSVITRAASGVAAALNGDVIRRAAWESTRLAAGDEVEIVTAVQGG
jgi:sulfur carrier protein